MRRAVTKPEQEEMVADAFAQAYLNIGGVALEVDASTRDPNAVPDFIFRAGAQLIGAELFELQQHYDQRVSADHMIDQVTAEFTRREVGQRYRGVLLSLGLLITPNAEGTPVAIKGTQFRLAEAVCELVDLFTSEIHTGDELLGNEFGVSLRIEPATYPALSSFARSILCLKYPADHEMGKLDLPRISVFAGRRYTDPEMIEEVSDQLVKKIRRRPAWRSVDRSILVAHDFPRGFTHEGPDGSEWEKWLSSAARNTTASQHFDEIWLLPFTRGNGSRIGDFAGNAVRVMFR